MQEKSHSGNISQSDDTIAFNINEIVVKGKIVKISQIKDEEWQDRNLINDPEMVIELIKKSGLKADIFSFRQRFPDMEPKYNYYYEMNNLATIRITTYDNWWTKQVNDKTRNCVRKAFKSGVELKVSSFDDDLLKGIVEIYNEVPIRQGKPFWHYKKGIETVRSQNSSYVERSDFIGAYFEQKLIGFVKMVYCGKYARIMQILSKIEFRNKNPMNALISKAVEICAEKKIENLVYGSYVYGKMDESSLQDFKKHNSFEKIDFPRYFIPLTFKGKIAIRFGLYNGLTQFIPKPISKKALSILKKYYAWKYRNVSVQIRK